MERGRSTVTRESDFILHTADAGFVGIPCSGVQERAPPDVPPDVEEIKETLRKCLALNAVPVLIARRIPFVTFNVLGKCGLIIHQTYNQLLPATDAAIAEKIRDKNLLGYHDVRLGNIPDARLVKFITVNLPAVARDARAKFEDNAHLLEAFAFGDMGYEEFTGRVLRRARGEDERDLRLGKTCSFQLSRRKRGSKTYVLKKAPAAKLGSDHTVTSWSEERGNQATRRLWNGGELISVLSSLAWRRNMTGNGHQTAEQAKQAHIDKMGAKLGAQYSALWQELLQLHVNWKEYVELFGTKPERIALLNRAAGSFFRMLQDELFETALLHIARITDPAASPGGKENLTIQNLPALIDDQITKAKVQGLVDVAVKEGVFCRDWRNRRIAHRDLTLALEEQSAQPQPLANASRKQVSDTLKALADVMNAVAQHYLGSTTLYDFGGRLTGASVACFTCLTAASR